MKRRGLTLVELMCSLLILAVLMVLVFQLIDRTLGVWRRSETRSSLLEQAASVADLFAHDLRGLENGTQGDLVLEWARFDTDGDGIGETFWPRLRLVRQGSSAEVARLTEELQRENNAPKTGDAQPRVLRAAPGLIESIWLVAPASLTDPDARAEGILWRGERLVADASSKSFFAPDFMGSSGRPPAGATEELSSGILWMQVLLAVQTSVVHERWHIGSEPGDAAVSWDAWAKGRPDPSFLVWNQAHPSVRPAHGRPALPRRVRLELEFERESDRMRRTRLSANADQADGRLALDDGARMPEPGAFVRIDAEWLLVSSVDGDTAAVVRGQRGTTPRTHLRGALVHWGAPLARELTVTTCREDWNP